MIWGNGTKISGFTIQQAVNGIAVYSSGNIISDNILKNNRDGIYIQSGHQPFFLDAKENWVSNNIIVNNSMDGISLSKAYDTILENNIISHNGNNGIIISSGSYNIIENNILTNQIYLCTGHDSIVKDNVFTQEGIRTYRYVNNNILSGNSIYGKPIVFLDGKTDSVIEEEAGQIILNNCKRITINNVSISDSCCAICLLACHECTVEGCILENNTEGIYMSTECENNVIATNKIYHSTDGIRIDFVCKNNVIATNKISNSTNGISLSMSDKNTIEKNEVKNGLWGIDISNAARANRIYANNFIENEINAEFYGSLLNRWLLNYWDDWVLPLPKPIFGQLLFFWPYQIPWIQFDWLPAQEPYEW